MFSEPDSISLFCVYVYVFSFYSITPLCPDYVGSNPYNNDNFFSVDGHHVAFFMTEHDHNVFCNQNVTANISGNLYGATYLFPRLLSSLGT